MYIAFALTIAYLLGAVPFSLLIARLAGVRDLRQIGSGNLGATNVWRAAGPVAGMSVFLADIGKGAAAVFAALIILPSHTPMLLALAGLAAVLGHVFPIYLGFRGGKGAATGLGVMFMLQPLATLAALVVFLLVALVWRYVSLASICGALALFVAVVVQEHVLKLAVPDFDFYLTALLALLIIITHRQNV
ncbi:MAG: glycerol-3-phosphate 1-O-acyltransferase PlsY, partial [candidate division Zixibacteria bacterium]|nr:glycerol-3-phosphate 1-O-acyltransferase PlsY [candidate division Zixibacteria bacterium]